MKDRNAINARHGFITYKNYLVALSYLLGDYSYIKRQLKIVTQKQNVDIKKIRNLLLNSWNSEMLLNFPSLLNDDFLKFSNHWSPVQSYYAIYLASRALIVSKNFGARGDHSTTLEIISSNFIQVEKLFPEPWNLLFDSNYYQNTPTKIISINSLENPYHFKTNKDKLQSSLTMFLKTTFERIIDDKCEEWKIKNPIGNKVRKKLKSGIRKLLSSKQRKVSIFDCLYRLRIRSNYKDVDIFILGSSAPETKRYFTALCAITDKTLFLIESYIRMCIGKEKMDQIIAAYQATDNLGITSKLDFSVINRSKYYA